MSTTNAQQRAEIFLFKIIENQPNLIQLGNSPGQVSGKEAAENINQLYQGLVEMLAHHN